MIPRRALHFRLTAAAKAPASLADQPPLKLRRSAGALAKAEALRAKAEGGSYLSAATSPLLLLYDHRLSVRDHG